MVFRKLLSLKYRIAATVFVLEAVMLFWVLSTTLNYMEQQARDEMEQRHQVIAELVLDLTRNFIFSEEFDELQLYVEKLTLSSDVVAISVSNLKNIVVVHSDFHRVGEVVQTLPSDSNRYLMEYRITNQGLLQIVFSVDSIHEQISEARTLSLWLALTGMLVIAAAGILIGCFLTRRLTRLMQAIESFKASGSWQSVGIFSLDKGCLDKGCLAEGRLTGDSADMSNGDELSELSSAFNQLGQEVNRNVSSLQQERALLEQRVQERTQELEHAQSSLIETNKTLEQLATTDYLTGLSNRIRIETRIDQLYHECYQSELGFVLILLDIDHFKQVNDTYGHEVGDTTLVHLAQLLQDAFPVNHDVGRWGGEEFVLLCPKRSLSEGVAEAEQLRKRIELNLFPSVGHVTCSMGVAFSGKNHSAKDLLRRADDALYKAKGRGRNCVIADDYSDLMDGEALPLC